MDTRLFLSSLILGICLHGLYVSDQSTASGQNPQPGMSDALQAIRETAQQFEDVFNKGDATGVAALWTKEGEYVDETGTTITGRDEIEQAYSEFFRDNSGAKIQINTDSLRLLNDTTAIEQGTSLVEVPPAAATVGQYLAVHVKEEGKWKLASVHEEVLKGSIAQQDLADLDWLIGTWVAEEHGNKIESVCHWIGNHKFVRRDFTTTQFDGAQTSGVQLIGWNPQARHVQSWTFSPDGGHAVGTWTPTEGGWTAQMHGMTGEGISTSSTNVLRRLDDNAYVWQSVNRSVGGVAIPDTGEVILKRK